MLVAAAELARENKDLVGARKHIDRGLDRHPDTSRFYQLAADLDLAENHADRAEAVLRRGIDAASTNFVLKLLLAETLIAENKLDGEEGGISWIDRLRRLGLADGYVQYLEGQVAMAQQQWHDAISRLDSARSLLAGNTAIVSRINLLLAGCHSRSGETEKRVAALERAASGQVNAPVAGPLLAQTMESEGRLDEAIRVHLLLVESRPQSRLDLVRLLILKNARLPEPQRHWPEVERRLHESERTMPKAVEDLARLLRRPARGPESRGGSPDGPDDRPAQRSAKSQLQARTDTYRPARSEDPPGTANPRPGGEGAGFQPGDPARPPGTLGAVWGRSGHDCRGKTGPGRKQLPSADLPLFLDRLAQTELRLREPALARQYWNELVALQPDNFSVLLSLFDLSLQSNDLAGAGSWLKRHAESKATATEATGGSPRPPWTLTSTDVIRKARARN